MTQAHGLTTDQSSPVARTLGLVLFAALVIVMVVASMWLASPEPPRTTPPAFDQYAKDSVEQAMQADLVAEQIKRIIDLGDRFPGTSGHTAAAELVRETYAQAGLTVMELPVTIAAPTVTVRAIHDAQGQALGEVEIYPFLPAQTQGVVTPEDGLRGELILANDELLTSQSDFTGKIAVIDDSQVLELLGKKWTRYASLGFEGVIFTHRDGLGEIGWDETGVGGMSATLPINYPRLAATHDILDHLGEQVIIHVQTRTQAIEAPVIMGLLSPDGTETKDRGLLVVPVAYDAPTYILGTSVGEVAATNLAAQFQLIQALLPHRETLRRDVMFVATGSRSVGQTSLVHFISTIGKNQWQDNALQAILADLSKHETHLPLVDEIMAGIAQSPETLTDVEATEAFLSSLSPAARSFLDDQTSFVVNDLLIELDEKLLQANVDFLRINEDTDAQEFEIYRSAKVLYESVLAYAGYPTGKLVRTVARQPQISETLNLHSLLEVRFKQLHDYHSAGIVRSESARNINRLFASYDSHVIFTPYLSMSRKAGLDKPEQLSFAFGPLTFGGFNPFNMYSKLVGATVNNLMAGAITPNDDLTFVSLQNKHGENFGPLTSETFYGADFWRFSGYPQFAIINTERVDDYRMTAKPILDTDNPMPIDSIDASLIAVGETALSLAYGNGQFATEQVRPAGNMYGKVYVSGIGRSAVPSHPLQGAVVGEFSKTRPIIEGHLNEITAITNPYGDYQFAQAFMAVNKHDGAHDGWSPMAIRQDKRGVISHIKDESSSGQSVFLSIGTGTLGGDLAVNIVTFRGSSVAMTDIINPQTLKPFVEIQLVNNEGLDALSPELSRLEDSQGVAQIFVIPNQRVFVKLLAGSAENELVREVRAFMLNVLDVPEEDSEEIDEAKGTDISGPGFLVADYPMIRQIDQRIAASMSKINDQRLALQVRHGMADERSIAFHEKSKDQLEEAEGSDLNSLDSDLLSESSAIYQILNHPVLRSSLNEAVMSIIWYLALLVPFVFFFEKLVFGFSDVRRQLVAHAIIFLTIFSLLWVLHPAFEIIRSSLMILLGFIIMLISLGMVMLFYGKFKENLEAIQKSRGVVSEAEVNKMGVIGTAFMLGLNNMHRRRVRTGLTCATLVLITFAMISFTSVRSDLVDSQLSLGAASYQGILVKNDDMSEISTAKVEALKQRYAGRFLPITRSMAIGKLDWQRNRTMPEFQIQHTTEGTSRQAVSNAAVVLMPDEPLLDQLRFVSEPTWFTQDTMMGTVILTETTATRLQVKISEVDAGEAMVTINGREYKVLSIIDAQSLREMVDLNSQDILPFDVRALSEVRSTEDGANVLATDPYPRVSPDNLLIFGSDTKVDVGQGGAWRKTSLVLPLINQDGTKIPYPEARQIIDLYLEQTGEATFYGLDGVAYRGQRTRERSLAGGVDLLLPLIIGALTVLNTMRGSVYERRDEIFVYNAVGIAPRYIFFMFIAEAFVYAVVGAVLGYVLSQGTGRILSELGLTGGLNMTFASMSTVYASLAVMAAVFISTLFPALSAMRIAAPADESGWDIPDPEGDTLELQLPFTFDYRDRVAVIEFFTRILQDHGEGSSGPFLSAEPTLDIAMLDDATETTADTVIPSVSATIWLKPLDLGVSQVMTIALPYDAETGEYVAVMKLDRLSGTRESWLRLNRSFLVRVRRNFLHWRAVGVEQRRNYFDAASERLAQHLNPQEVAHG